MAKASSKEEPKPPEYPDVPDASTLSSFDLNIEDTSKPKDRRQTFGFAALIITLAVLVIITI